MIEEDNIDWSQTTWTGSRAAQLLDWSRLSLFEKFKAVEELEALGMEFINRRKAKGEPYIDPDTGELVPGKKTDQVAEPPKPYPESTAEKPHDNS